MERERETERSEIREEQTTLNKQIPPRRTESASFQLHRETSDATRHKGALQRRLLRTRTNHSPAVRWQLTATANICTVCTYTDVSVTETLDDIIQREEAKFSGSCLILFI